MLLASCVDACQLAYQNPANAVYPIESDNIQGFSRLIFIKGIPHIQIAIAGTNDLQDWFDNLMLCSCKYGFHCGWLHAYWEIELQIIEILKLYPKFSVVFTGHSAGAAIAGIASHFWSDKNPCDFVGFAAPRFCSESRAKELEKAVRVQVINHYLDPITYLPLSFTQLSGKRKWWWGNPHGLQQLRNKK